MKIVEEKKTLKTTIPFMALMVALNVILMVGANYLPVAGLILVVFLPLISSVYCLNTQYKYYPIYFVCSLGLGLVVNVSDLSAGFLYLLPSLLEGLIFTICIRKKLDGVLAFLYSTFILFVCEIVFIPILNFMYSIDSVHAILVIFNLANVTNIDYFVLGMIYLICTIEIFIVYIVVQGELTKLGYELKITEKINLELIIIDFLMSILTIISWIFKIYNCAFLFLFISIVTAILVSIQLFKQHKIYMYILIFSSIAISWITYIITLGVFNATINFLILIVFSLCIGLISLIYYIHRKMISRENKEETKL